MTDATVHGAAGNDENSTFLMVPYGSLEPVSTEDESAKDGDNRPHSEGDGGKTPATCTASLIPAGGLVSTAFGLASLCIGAGILGLPAAANMGGLVMTFVYPMIVVFLCIYSLYCLGMQVERHGFRSYEETAHTLMGFRCWCLTGIFRVVETFGASIAQIIAISDILNAILRGTSAPEFLKSRGGNRLLTFIIWLCFMLPLVLPREVNSLRYVSIFSVVFIFYLMGVIVVHSCMNGLPENIQNIHMTGKPGDEGIHLFGVGNRVAEAPGVFTFAFVCHAAAFEVYLGMAKPSAHAFAAYSAVAMVICFVLCIMTASFGYLDFGGKVTGSVLLMYDPVKEPAVMVGFIVLLTKLFSSYAFLVMTCRNGLCNIIGWDMEKLPCWKHCAMMVTLAAITMLCGLFIPNINTVFGFVGAVCGGFLAFILPSLFMMYGGNWSLQTVGWFHYIATHAVLLAGVALTVFGTGATMYGVIVGW